MNAKEVKLQNALLEYGKLVEQYGRSMSIIMAETIKMNNLEAKLEETFLAIQDMNPPVRPLSFMDTAMKLPEISSKVVEKIKMLTK